jgi:hypothetical protein
MPRNIQTGLFSLLALLFAILLLLDAAYFFNGSLELFPTPDQQAKVRGVAVLLGACFAVTEVAICYLLARLLRKKQATDPRREGTA